MKSKKSAEKRPTIGVFLAQVNRVWGREFMAGIQHAAEIRDVNLVCFVGGRPSSVEIPGQPQPAYDLYALAKPGQFDGIILATDIGYGLNSKELEDFCQAVAPTPLVAHAIDVKGVPHVRADNLRGMKAIMRHLIEEHEYKDIAFIRGIAGQIEAEERFQAYREELNVHGIPLQENLVIQGDFTPESGRAAIQTLLDDRSERVQAIVAANDHMAYGALEALQIRGIQVPETVALTGFDDIRETQSLGVPLTTVRQSFTDLGQQIVASLMQRIKKKKVPHAQIVNSELVIRWSCGCLPEVVRQAVITPRQVTKTGELKNKREAAISALLSAADLNAKEPVLDQFKEIFGHMWDVFLASLQDDSMDDEFLHTTNTAIDLLRRHGLNPPVWHDVISTLRRHAMIGISGESNRIHAENLFQQARLLTGELSQRAQAMRRLQFEKQEDIFQDFGFSMAPAMSLDEIGEAIIQNFPRMGIDRWYVMFYSDVSTPTLLTAPPPEEYRLLLQYDHGELEIPQEPTNLSPGGLVPREKKPVDVRYTAVVMPLTLAHNRFGFMWAEKGPEDWDVYTRIRNLVSSALLRTMLVQQREEAQKEVERLLEEARERAAELAVARDIAEKAAIDKEKLYDSEQNRRQTAEALARAARQLSSLEKIEKVPAQILEEMGNVLAFDRGFVILEDSNQIPQVVAHAGLPDSVPVTELRYTIKGKEQDSEMYDSVARMKESIQFGDAMQMEGWTQPDWLPPDRSWMGAPLFFKDEVMGMLVVTREQAWAFNKDDALTMTTFAVQAAIAIENARLYDEINRFGQMMERMVEQRVEELASAYETLEKLDKNKSTFIQVAAHELRTPLTVIKGYLGMLRGNSTVQDNEALIQALEGVMQGTDRLHLIVNSMLDVARLENQVLSPQLESLSLAPILRLIQKKYQRDLEARSIAMTLDESKQDPPLALVDPELINKALDNIIVNAIKFTPDGGSVTVSTLTVEDEVLGRCTELRVEDTGIGISRDNLAIIFEKLYQLGEVQLHSSGRTSFKGGGPGLGLAIAAGIIKAHGGKIWAESPGYDEKTCPGSTFFVRLRSPNESGESQGDSA